MSTTDAAATTPVELIVHLGDGTTGAAQAQRILRQRAAELDALGTRFLGQMLERVQPRRFDWQHEQRVEAFHALPAGRAAAEAAAVLDAAVADACERGARRLVWINDTLLRRGTAALDALRRLDPARVRVRPVAYVREHGAWARDAYLQWGLRHKTYDGPVQPFDAWAGKRRFDVADRLAPWLEAFGDDVDIRNHDALADAAADFLGSLGLAATPSPSPPARPMEELALRAIFNDRIAGPVAPARFNDLLGAQDIDFGLAPERWLEQRLPSADDLARLAGACAVDRAALDALLAARGQPALAPSEAAGLVALDGGTLAGVLFQMLLLQATRVERLEQRVAQLEAAPTATPVVAMAPDVPADPLIARSLAPALGYFGATAADALEVPVGAVVRSLRLSLDEQAPTFLNLRRLELLQGGKAIAPAPGWRVSQSSTTGAEAANGAANLLTGQGIHSGAEKAPSWTATFDPPIAVDMLRLYNRSDGWGSRSRTLRIDAVLESGETLRLHTGLGEAGLRCALAGSAAAAGVALPDPLPASAEALEGLRARLIAALAERLRQQLIAPADVPWRDVLRIFDVWGQRGEPGDDDLAVLSAFLIHQSRQHAGMSIKSFSLLLDTQQRLRRLQDAINALAAEWGLGGFMLTRHGVKPQGVLRREPQRFLHHLVAVVDVLRRLDRDPVLAYGTLLGAVRDHHFIAHDDDVDLLYRSGASSRAEVEAELPVLKAQLQDAGFKVVDLLPNSLNMHVIDARNGAVMDVFPCWLEDGSLQMHMESMKIRGIDPAIVHPSGAMDFLGTTLPVPAKPEAFLEERYGPGWSVSDQFFEWPWPLKADAPST